MKKICLFFATALAIVAVSCDPPKPKTFEVPVQLQLDGQPFAIADVLVTLASGDALFEGTTDAAGSVTFTVPVGVYTATTSFKKSEAGILYNYNGSANVPVTEAFTGTVNLAVTASKTSQLIIKEVYNGGCKDNAGTKNYQYDKYVIVYNNSDTEVDASGMCLAMAQITSTRSTNKYEISASGVIEYEAAGWTPASYGIWWFQDGVEVKIAPFSQIVIALNGAIDHTPTYSNSVDLSKADFCTYDPESGFANASYYPAPSSSIPANHYMKTYEFGQGNAWPIPIKTAAPYLIMPGSDIKAFVKDPANFDNRSTNLSGNYAKIPTEWVLDAVDIWGDADETKNFSRFPSTVNTGYVVFATNGMGYSTYRNVDKAATEAIPENAGKLVTGYSGALDPDKDNDPSGIDAEASIANGAKIVYMDTNNSTNDFHIRKTASLKK